MADSKISALTELSAAPATGDLLVLVDVSDTTMAASGTNKKITWANALTNATLITPTIASFANATHDHLSAAGGGTLSGYLAATGATTGASSQAQTFTNGIVGPSWRPASDSTTALRIFKSDGSTLIMQVNTTNSRVGIGSSASDLATSTDTLFVVGTTKVSNAGASVFPAHYIDAVTTSGFPAIVVRRARGTVLGSESQVLSGDFLGAVEFRGYHSGAAYHSTGTAAMRSYAGEDFTSSAKGGELRFYTTSLASTTLSQRVTINPDGYTGFLVTSPTALVHIAASTTARSSARIAAGSRPTTPNTGDIWDDGALVAYQVNSTTNAVANSLKLERGSSGTPAAGFGLGIVAQLESSTTDTQDAGRLTWAWSTATHASRVAVGILSAYYTSTEREAIRWVADSSTVKVGIAGVTSPSEALEINGRLSSLSVGATTAGFWFKDASANARGFVGLSDDSASPKVGIYNAGYGAYLFTGDSNGRVGIGATTTPLGLIHGHDGSGGFMFVNQASVGGTAVTVLTNGTGDVTERLWLAGWCSNSSPFTADIAMTTLAVSSSTTKTDGVNTLTIAVAADGSVTLQATAGAATWKVFMWMMWR